MDRRQFGVGVAASLLVVGKAGLVLAQDAVPTGYPADYQQIIDAAKKEAPMLFYTSIASDQIQPLLDGFKKVYPWSNVQHLEQGSDGVIDRYNNEVGTNTPTASLLFTAAPDKWMDLIKRKQVLDYNSPEQANYPKEDAPFPGLYTGGGDPMIFIWNKLLVQDAQAPQSLQQLVSQVKSDPGTYQGKVVTYGIDTGFGYRMHWALAKHLGDKIWDYYKVLGPVSKFERSVGSMIEKVQSGEYLIGYGAAAETPFTMIQDPSVASVLGVGYMKDATPLSIRGIAVSAAGKSPATAKLMLDFILSKPGQILYATKGKLPARPDVTSADLKGGETITTMNQKVGAQNVEIIGYDQAMIDGLKDFTAKWDAANGVQQ